MTERCLPFVLALLLVGCAGESGIPAPTPRSPVAPRHARVERAPSPSPAQVQVQVHERNAPAARAVTSQVAPRVGLVASDDPAVTAALAAGARRAFEEARAAGGPDLALLVGERERHWASAAAAAVRMAMDEGAVAVIAPPERRRAHEIAQFGTRAGVPVVSTSPAETVAQAGSTWVVSVVAAERAPDAWDTAGYDAGCAVVAAVRRNGLRREGLAGALAGGEPFEGTGGPVRIAANGSRAPR